MKDAGLEELRKIFEDKRLWIGIGTITATEMAKDRSVFRCRVMLMPERREVVCAFTADSVRAWGLPSVEDQVIVAAANGDDDSLYILKVTSSRADKIPERAESGNQVLGALPGKKIWLQSDTKMLLARGDEEPTENLVLGQVLKQLLSDILAELKAQADTLKEQADQLQTMATDLSTHAHTGVTTGPGTSGPPATAAAYVSAATAFGTASGQLDTNSSNFDGKKESPVDDEAMLSDLAFTEK